MKPFEISLVPCLTDNYAVLIHASASGETLTVDAPETSAISAALAQRSWRLTHILVTHHHNDHTGGIAGLKAHYGCNVYGSAIESERIPGLDLELSESSKLTFAGEEIRVLETPGHTLGHVTYHLPGQKLAFTGDTLFSLGCGRIFEGDAETMWHSLQKIARLPDDTAVCCGHEYTLANGRFALSVEPENEFLKRRMVDVERLRSEGAPTLPTTIALEKATNPFLRPASANIRARLGLQGMPDWRVFQRLRELKNKA
jgi:hydroxyacylglutathione hydrolase